MDQQCDVTVGVVGLGVVGETVAAAFAETGVEVRRYDRYLQVGTPEDLQSCDVVFTCVQTPSDVNGSHDLTWVRAAVEEVEPHLRDETIVGIKSTVSPGTCDELAIRWPRLLFVSVPEFLVAARPRETFMRPDRVIIGANSPQVAHVLKKLMARVAPTAPIVALSPTEAELAKLASNAMLAAKVTLANELWGVCRSFGVEWSRVQSAVGLDRRIGPDHMTVIHPFGFGGGCLPKDLDGLIASSEAAGYTPEVLKAIARFNRQITREARSDTSSAPSPAEDASLVHLSSARAQ